MLSSQALNVGRSLGQGLAIVDSAVRGYHVYKDVWKPAIGEKLHAEQEPDNAADKFAMKVVKYNKRFLVCWCLFVRVKQFTFRAPLSTQEYKRVLASCQGCQMKCWISIPSSGDNEHS